MDYRRQGHCVYCAQYHLVLVSKYRRKIFNEVALAYLKDILRRIKEYYTEVDIGEVNGEVDHIHFLVSIPPKMAVGRVVNIIKSNTARAQRGKFEYLRKECWGDAGIWSDGYFVSTVGLNEETIKKYIQRQGNEDSGQAKLELKKCHGRKPVEVYLCFKGVVLYNC